MLRLLDRSFTLLLTLISLVLLLLWFRSYAVGDRYRWVELIEFEQGGLMLHSGDIWTGDGGLALNVQRQIADGPESEAALRRRAQRRSRWAPIGYSRSHLPAYPVHSGDGVLGPLGMNFQRDQRSDAAGQRSGLSIGFPLWIPVLVGFIYPLLRFIRGVIQRERQERMILGLCPRCGIDVRNRPPRCPSCGMRHPLLLPQRMAA